MNAYGRVEGAALRQRVTYNFDMPPSRPAAPDLNYLRASGLAQVRLQLAVLSGNRRGALRELDRLVEIDRQLEVLASQGRTGGLPGASLLAQLDEQREAIASEKLALMAAIEFPRLAPAERVAEQEDAAEEEFVVIEDTEFGRKLGRALAWALGLIVMGTLLAFALPALAVV
jgi:hypothetical protein